MLQYTVVFKIKTISSVNSKIKAANYKSFLAFFNLGSVASPFSQEIEPTVSYKQFLIKNTCNCNESRKVFIFFLIDGVFT